MPTDAHPTFTVKEGPSSAVTAKLVSGDGNFVVVKATAAGTTVPSAGLWRVDRRDGSTLRLPDGYGPFSISPTGAHRAALQPELPPVIWSNGTLVTPPGPVMPRVSADLAFALFVDSAGAVQRLEIATGTITPVETGVPRPAQYTYASPLGISDDGKIAQIALGNSCCSGGLMRFIDIAAHTATDVAFQSGGDITDTFTMAAGNGAAFLMHHLDVYVDPTDPSHTIKNADWVELRRRATGAVVRHYDVPAGRDVVKLSIAASVFSAWIMQAHFTTCDLPGVQFPCFDNSEAVVMLAAGTRSFSTGGGGFVDAFSTTPSGRFLAFDFARGPDERIPYGPTTIIDWVTGNVEQLTGSVNYQLNDPPVCSLLGRSLPDRGGRFAQVRGL